jgi:hypothetical protein
VNPKAARWLRLSGLLWIVLFLVWLPIEDLDERWVMAHAAAGCLWGSAYYLHRRPADLSRRWQSFLILGGAAGLMLTPAALFLMVFKNGLHAHPTPDFTVSQMGRVIELTPMWILSGLLIGLGAGIWWKTRNG